LTIGGLTSADGKARNFFTCLQNLQQRDRNYLSLRLVASVLEASARNVVQASDSAMQIAVRNGEGLSHASCWLAIVVLRNSHA